MNEVELEKQVHKNHMEQITSYKHRWDVWNWIDMCIFAVSLVLAFILLR